ncbi:hypothetical protein ACIRP2_21765 [Streptomyces sp. NPDC101194]|uniref:hypothetical protein n=1 Tax=Streptomyces sp. NPDC101194 TaxID=3366127 RepID=UPI003816310C
MGSSDVRMVEDPSATDLYDLLSEMNFRYWVSVEKPDLSPPGQHCLQIRMDVSIPSDDGRGYILECREGRSDRHVRAVATDSAPWDSALSPAFELVAKVVDDWVRARDTWREAMPWERVDVDID